MSDTILSKANYSEWIEAHLEEVRREIESRAKGIGGDGVTLEDVAAAIAVVCPIKHKTDEMSKSNPGLLRVFFASLPAIAWVSAVLAIVFGVLGIFAPGHEPTQQQGWLDIAKIFAGAVVGAAGTTISKQFPRL